MSHYRYYFPIGVLFVAVLLISNTTAVKLVSFGPFVISGAIVIFPISYIFGDILTEVYGYRASRRIIWMGFTSQILMSICYMIIQRLPAAPFWHDQAAFDAILGAVPRIVIASILAFVAGEFSNSYVLSRMKVWMNGKRLWMRTIGSTLVGEGVDSVLFALIAFGGLLPWGALFTVIYSGYILKVVYEVIATPLTYAIVRELKRREGVDVYDRNINYSPFHVSENV
jgi:queuosine precursor transporter